MAGKRILVVDGDKRRREDTLGKLARLHFDTLEAEDGVQALARIENDEPDLVLCDHGIKGHSVKEMCDYVHEFVSGHVPVALFVPETETDPEKARKASGADAALCHPVPDALLGSLCRLLLSVSELTNQLDHVQEENLQLHRDSEACQAVDPGTRFYRFDIFKHVILMEVKKAKRYGYALSLLLLSIDRLQEISGWLTAEQRLGLFGEVQCAITSVIRDIDIPLLFAEEKILVVMPHTALEGAATVADRIRAKASAIRPPESLAQLKISTSLAVSSTEGIAEVSFGKLIQDAMRGLKEAEIKGGDVVIVCRPPPDQSNPELPPATKLGPRTYFV